MFRRAAAGSLILIAGREAKSAELTQLRGGEIATKVPWQ
jgi:hypothetical protein